MEYLRVTKLGLHVLYFTKIKNQFTDREGQHGRKKQCNRAVKGTYYRIRF